MTTKDYIILAAAIKTAFDSNQSSKEGQMGVRMSAFSISAACQDQNPRFSRSLFLKACGLSGEVA